MELRRRPVAGGFGAALSERRRRKALGENRWFQKLKDEEIGGGFLYILANMA
jgi:hypothetical protein